MDRRLLVVSLLVISLPVSGGVISFTLTDGDPPWLDHWNPDYNDDSTLHPDDILQECEYTSSYEYRGDLKDYEIPSAVATCVMSYTQEFVLNLGYGFSAILSYLSAISHVMWLAAAHMQEVTGGYVDWESGVATLFNMLEYMAESMLQVLGIITNLPELIVAEVRHYFIEPFYNIMSTARDIVFSPLNSALDALTSPFEGAIEWLEETFQVDIDGDGIEDQVKDDEPEVQDGVIR